MSAPARLSAAERRLNDPVYQIPDMVSFKSHSQTQNNECNGDLDFLNFSGRTFVKEDTPHRVPQSKFH
jgi:hypothetical protein